jgi:endoribonuclease Dicer
MPTKRIADKSAALEAIQELHKAGELNEHLLPISKMVDLSDDEATRQERSRHEGTAKRANNYPNKVLVPFLPTLP